MFNEFYQFLSSNKYTKPVKSFIADCYYKPLFRIISSSNTKKFYRVFGMRRTGNHAIINWIMEAMDGPVIFCNDLLEDQHPINSSIKRFRLKSGNPNLIVSYEDFFSTNFKLGYTKKWYGVSIKKFNILILRDPFNLLASRYVWKLPPGKVFRENHNYRKKVVDNWKDNAKTFLEWKKKHISHKIPLNYNKWCTKRKYQIELLNTLNLQSVKFNTETVLNFGGGSSFEGTNERAKNKKKYLTRFTSLLNHKNFKKIFEDKELVELSNTIFGEVEGSEELIK